MFRLPERQARCAYVRINVSNWLTVKAGTVVKATPVALFNVTDAFSACSMPGAVTMARSTHERALYMISA